MWIYEMNWYLISIFEALWYIYLIYLKAVIQILLCTEEFISAGLFHCYSLSEPYLKSPIKTVTVHKGKATHNDFLKTLYVAVNKG